MLNKQVFSFFASCYFLRGNGNIENDPELCLSNVEAEVAISPATSITDTHSLTSEDASPAALLAGINTGHMHFFYGSSRLLCLYGLWNISTFFFNHENKDSPSCQASIVSHRDRTVYTVTLFKPGSPSLCSRGNYIRFCKMNHEGLPHLHRERSQRNKNNEGNTCIIYSHCRHEVSPIQDGLLLVGGLQWVSMYFFKRNHFLLSRFQTLWWETPSHSWFAWKQQV